jgi:NADH dehydrogenase
MRNELITVFGGSGFIGRYLVRQLCRRGYRVRVATRRPHLAVDLKVSGETGQIQLIQANIRDRASVERAVEGADGVVNLVGVMIEEGRQSFSATMTRGAGLIAEAAAATGVRSLVHVSANGAAPESRSRFGRAKAAGEDAVRAAFPGAVILRPCTVFGPEDKFFNKFGQMTRFSPVLPVLGGGRSKMQPVYAGDVARAICGALERPEAQGRTYVLAGPSVYSFRELMEFMLAQTGKRRALIPLPWPVSTLLGKFGGALGRLPFVTSPLTADQVAWLRRDDVAPEREPGLQALGVTLPETIESVVPIYLRRFRRPGGDEASLTLAEQVS